MERSAEYENVREQWKKGKMSARVAARHLGITHGTFLRWVREDDG